jgi:hypothetical protein
VVSPMMEMTTAAAINTARNFDICTTPCDNGDRCTKHRMHISHDQ